MLNGVTRASRVWDRDIHDEAVLWDGMCMIREIL